MRPLSAYVCVVKVTVHWNVVETGTLALSAPVEMEANFNGRVRPSFISRVGVFNLSFPLKTPTTIFLARRPSLLLYLWLEIHWLSDTSEKHCQGASLIEATCVYCILLNFSLDMVI